MPALNAPARYGHAPTQCPCPQCTHAHPPIRPTATPNRPPATPARKPAHPQARKPASPHVTRNTPAHP
ncbi:hypothetical protein OF83DRAFT_1180126, partial [Amylostereum chailletii]